MCTLCIGVEGGDVEGPGVVASVTQKGLVVVHERRRLAFVGGMCDSPVGHSSNEIHFWAGGVVARRRESCIGVPFSECAKLPPLFPANDPFTDGDGEACLA